MMSTYCFLGVGLVLLLFTSGARGDRACPVTFESVEGESLLTLSVQPKRGTNCDQLTSTHLYHAVSDEAPNHSQPQFSVAKVKCHISQSQIIDKTVDKTVETEDQTVIVPLLKEWLKAGWLTTQSEQQATVFTAVKWPIPGNDEGDNTLRIVKELDTELWAKDPFYWGTAVPSDFLKVITDGAYTVRASFDSKSASIEEFWRMALDPNTVPTRLVCQYYLDSGPQQSIAELNTEDWPVIANILKLSPNYVEATTQLSKSKTFFFVDTALGRRRHNVANMIEPKANAYVMPLTTSAPSLQDKKLAKLVKRKLYKETCLVSFYSRDELLELTVRSIGDAKCDELRSNHGFFEAMQGFLSYVDDQKAEKVPLPRFFVDKLVCHFCDPQVISNNMVMTMLLAEWLMVGWDMNLQTQSFWQSLDITRFLVGGERITFKPAKLDLTRLRLDPRDMKVSERDTYTILGEHVPRDYVEIHYDPALTITALYDSEHSTRTQFWDMAFVKATTPKMLFWETDSICYQLDNKDWGIIAEAVRNYAGVVMVKPGHFVMET